MVVTFGVFEEAWRGHGQALVRLIETHSIKRVCEVGGGANPALNLDYVRRYGLDYAILDVSAEELAKAPSGYRKILADVCSPSLAHVGEFDLVFTKMLAEHVRDGRLFHQHVRAMLANGGLAFHFFPTLYAAPFVANLMLPEVVTGALLDAFSPRDRAMHGKFRARYSWCRGPTPRQVRRLEALGYEVLQYRGFFGHAYYERIPILRSLARTTARYLVAHPISYVTTFAYLVMRKGDLPSIEGRGLE